MMVLLCTEILMEAYECSLAMHINYIRPISCRYDEWRRAAATATREIFLMDSWLRQTTKTIWSEPLNFDRFLPKPTGTRSNACLRLNVFSSGSTIILPLVTFVLANDEASLLAIVWGWISDSGEQDFLSLPRDLGTTINQSKERKTRRFSLLVLKRK